MKSKISVLFLFFTAFVFAEDPIKIISSDYRSIVIEFTPEYLNPVEEIINNQKYLSINFKYGFINSEKPGEPAIPEYVFNVGVPSETGNTIEVLNSIYKEIEGMIIPTPVLVKDDQLYHYEYRVNEKYFNYKPDDELAAFGEFGIARGIKKQGIRILPVKFDPSKNRIRLYSKIVIRINFAPGVINPAAEKDELISGSIINYDIAYRWKEKNKHVQKGKAVENSVLAQGTWYRFETPEEGIYRITRSMLASYGIDANTVDPRTIKIYNNGGKLLPDNPGDSRPVDLVENAIQIVGEEDGKFDEGDYILFYGRGTDFWDYDTITNTIKRYKHYYSAKNYYWITSGGSNGKRIQTRQSLNDNPQYVQTSTQAFAFWDEDKINIGQSGRIFVGDVFSQSFPSRTYMNNLDYRINSFPVNYSFRLINSSLEKTSLQFRVYVNATLVSTVPIGGIFGDYTAGIEARRTINFNEPLAENRSLLKFEIAQPSVYSVGYLDYFEIKYQRELKPSGNYLLFFSYDTTAVIEYQLSNFPSSNIRVFDVTDFSNVKSVTPKTGYPNGGEFRFQAAEVEGSPSRYLAVGNDEFKTPVNPVKIENSNLRGIADGAKFIIITHPNFRAAADRLKSYRESESKTPISTIVIDVQHIYNEFSGGLLDVSAIRDFIKYAYENWTIEPEYVLFFGSGNYDYKNIEGVNTNYIPTWQSLESLDLLKSYTTDDFFVQIDPGDNTVDFATGRIPVKTLNEAEKVVNKIIDYENNSEVGLWRNLVTLVADDGNEDGTTHTSQSETLSGRIPDYFDLKKIYMQSYPAVLTGSGRRMPEVNQAIINAINEGTIILNYIGHGNQELWAHEVVFDRNLTIPQLRNENQYFFLVAATCSFGYFDIPGSRSASEDLLLLENAGSIASLTASRVVYSQPNAIYTYDFYNNLLSAARDENGYTISIGKANFNTKFNDTSQNTQKYFIFGDPTLRLRIPRYQASIDSINGMPADQNEIQIKALSKILLKGAVRNFDTSIWEGYNGEGIINVFDSERIENIDFGSIDLPVTKAGGVIFRGRVSVTNGRFNAEFVVPKDISYENKKGKIVFYFYSGNDDGLGFTDNIIVGGTDSTAVNDGSGPEIDIYFDDPSYSDSYLINPNSKLIIELRDETGINTTGTGVGHRLEGVLNDNEADPIDFSGFFTGDLDAGGKSGVINYSFDDIETGEYKLDVKAWDVFNNFSKETAYFSVVTGDDLVIRDVYNYPNPFSSNTTFTFQQNFNSPLNVEVRIYTIAGRLIKVIKEDFVNEKFVTIDWDGRDDDGSQLANGTYLYKLKVATTDGQYSKSILGKLAVIR